MTDAQQLNDGAHIMTLEQLQIEQVKLQMIVDKRKCISEYQRQKRALIQSAIRVERSLYAKP